MSERIQKQKPAPQEREAAPQAQPEVVEADAALLAAEEDLMDEIDRILEDQEVLTNFRQKGGE